ncbi:hypothetical protein C8R44DRAFT_805823 [Mycena epipterygia]|nr:hypothetical protein C8R44DRAFT_805823 [Mycena epipterygia]
MASHSTMRNIALEPHLVEILTPLPPLLRPEPASQPVPYISEPVPTTVPYTLLQSISQWTRTPAGLAALQSVSLESQSYTMIPLLAGSVSSLERKFPAYTADNSPEEAAALRKAERQTITSLLNALLSIIGSGLAACVLFSLFIGAVDSRCSRNSPRRKLKVSAKKRDESEVVEVSRIEHGTRPGLRQRALHHNVIFSTPRHGQNTEIRPVL